MKGFVATVILGATTSVAAAQVRVVDVIPKQLSGESYQNSEPTLAVNPRAPGLLAASAYVRASDVCARRVVAPMFVSRDTGNTWRYVCKIKVDTSSNAPPGDVSLRWSPDGHTLLAALLWPLFPVYTLQILQTPDVLSVEDFVPLARIDTVDQPNLEVAGDSASARFLVAANFMSGVTSIPGQHGTAAVLNRVLRVAPGAPRSIDTTLVDPRDVAGQNYAIRLATHPSGKAYAFFYSPLPPDGNLSDLVVVRDDSINFGSTKFRALLDSAPDGGGKCVGHDGLPGMRVARCRAVPYYNGSDPTFGEQRRVSANLSIAVDPSPFGANSVWVAWSDSIGASHSTLHLRHSYDGGNSWSFDLLTIPEATNPALAVNSAGQVAFLYQELSDPRPHERWTTKVLVSGDNFATYRSYVLATFPVSDVRSQFQPYLGDYVELHALGETFYGIFSSGNVPDARNFPNGVKFLRNVDTLHTTLLDANGTRRVPPSIDPFFFSIGPRPHQHCQAIQRNLQREHQVVFDLRRRIANLPPDQQEQAGDRSSRAEHTIEVLRARFAEIGCQP